MVIAKGTRSVTISGKSRLAFPKSFSQTTFRKEKFIMKIGNQISKLHVRSSKKLYVKLIVAAIICTWLGLPAQHLFASSTCNLGMIDDKPSKIIKRFSPLMDYLKSKGFSGKVLVAKDKEKMIEMFKNGEVDFMFESPYLSIEIMDAVGAVPIMIREKSGIKEYNSVIFVKKDSPIQKVTDLKGKVIAFEDPGSTSSFVLPKNILTAAGLDLKESKDPVPGSVAYYFSKEDKNTIYHVKAGKTADAGGIKKGEVEKDDSFRILAESPYVPRHVVLVRKGYSPEKLKEILLAMKSDTAAKPVLEKIKTSSGFSEFDGDPIEVMNVTVRKALGL